MLKVISVKNELPTLTYTLPTSSDRIEGNNNHPRYEINNKSLGFSSLGQDFRCENVNSHVERLRDVVDHRFRRAAGLPGPSAHRTCSTVAVRRPSHAAGLPSSLARQDDQIFPLMTSEELQPELHWARAAGSPGSSRPRAALAYLDGASDDKSNATTQLYPQINSTKPMNHPKRIDDDYGSAGLRISCLATEAKNLTVASAAIFSTSSLCHTDMNKNNNDKPTRGTTLRGRGRPGRGGSNRQGQSRQEQHTSGDKAPEAQAKGGQGRGKQGPDGPDAKKNRKRTQEGERYVLNRTHKDHAESHSSFSNNGNERGSRGAKKKRRAEFFLTIGDPEHPNRPISLKRWKTEIWPSIANQLEDAYMGLPDGSNLSPTLRAMKGARFTEPRSERILKDIPDDQRYYFPIVSCTIDLTQMFLCHRLGTGFIWFQSPQARDWWKEEIEKILTKTSSGESTNLSPIGNDDDSRAILSLGLRKDLWDMLGRDDETRKVRLFKLLWKQKGEKMAMNLVEPINITTRLDTNHQSYLYKKPLTLHISLSNEGLKIVAVRADYEWEMEALKNRTLEFLFGTVSVRRSKPSHRAKLEMEAANQAKMAMDVEESDKNTSNTGGLANPSINPLN